MNRALRKILVRLAVALSVLVGLFFALVYIVAWAAHSPSVPKNLRMAAAYLDALRTASSHNRPMAFYGRVIDQNGDPVVDADVGMSYEIASASEILEHDIGRLHPLPLKTDSTGAFRVENLQGVCLSLGGIKKPGYLKMASEKGRSYVYSFNTGSPTYHPDPAKPETFILWKMIGSPEPLRTVGFGNSSWISVSTPGQTVSVFLAGRDYSPTYENGRVSDADLWITANFPGRRENPCDYSLNIESPTGGLVKTSDLYAYLAPAEGYSQTAELKRRALDPDWQDEIVQKFYFRRTGGTLYGSIKISAECTDGRRVVISITGAVNENASRNLQPGRENYRSTEPF